jgi:hypothetical protein
MHPPRNRHLRAAIEISSIIFLFYANLLMGEFTGANGRGKLLSVALRDIFTPKTMAIALVTSIAGHLVFQLLREKS